MTLWPVTFHPLTVEVLREWRFTRTQRCYRGWRPYGHRTIDQQLLRSRPHEAWRWLIFLTVWPWNLDHLPLTSRIDPAMYRPYSLWIDYLVCDLRLFETSSEVIYLWVVKLLPPPPPTRLSNQLCEAILHQGNNSRSCERIFTKVSSWTHILDGLFDALRCGLVT